MRVDLHIHSKYSDGLLSIKEIANILKKNKVKLFSLTDHDSLDGLMEASHESAKEALDFIPGLELSCDFQGKEIHLLAYNFDKENSDLIKLLHDMKKERSLRAEKILGKLQSQNLLGHLDQDFLKKDEGVLGRPFIADLLIEKGIVKNRKEAFLKYLNEGQPAWVPRLKPSLEEGINLVKKAGGIPVIAHPGTSCIGFDLNQLLPLGLEGIEVWHPDHNAILTDYYFRFAENKGLIKTGGSDWHGDKDYSFYNSIQMSYEDISLIKGKGVNS